MKIQHIDHSFTIELAKFVANDNSVVKLVEALAGQYVGLVTDTKYQTGSSLRQRFGDERVVKFNYELNSTLTYFVHPNLFSFEFDGIQIRAIDLIDATSICEMRGWRCPINRQILVDSIRILETQDPKAVSEQGRLLLKQASLLNAAINEFGELEQAKSTKQIALRKLGDFAPDARALKILVAMYNNNVTNSASKKKYQSILDYFDATQLASDNGRNFGNLKDQGLIRSGKNNQGCWLTEQGIEAALALLSARVE